MERNYILAILEIFNRGDDDPSRTLLGLKHTLENRGHQKLHRRILSSVLREVQLMKNNSQPKVSVACSKDLEKYKALIERTLQELGSTSPYEPHIDDSIIGGVIVESSNIRVDHSYRTKLISLYRSFT